MDADVAATVYERATRYEVSVVPPGHPERRHFTLYVEWRAEDRWAVCDGFRECLNADGSWSYESVPSERADEWKAAHRFDLETALRLARAEAPKVEVNGRTFVMWQAFWADPDAGEASR